MAALIKEKKYIKSDVNKNNNKYWYIELYDDASTITRYGRIGAGAAIHPKSHYSMTTAESFFNAKCREKEKHGRNGEISYRSIDIISGNSISNNSNNSNNLNVIAQKQIRSKKKSFIRKLIDRLTKANAHHITTATSGQITFQDGVATTPLGIVTQTNIDEANSLLVLIGNLVADNNFNEELNNFVNSFLMLIPQKVGNKLNVKYLFGSLAKVQKQKTLLDALQASLNTVCESTNKDDKDDKDEIKIFNLELNLVEDKKDIDRISKLFDETKNNKHECSHLKVKTIYQISIENENKLFESSLGNIQELWHGTRLSNVLSILKQGLIVPPKSSSHCTGRSFGDGLYFSDQSTKSLNYSHGVAWGHGDADNNSFMFLADVAMGNIFEVEKNDYGSYPKDGFDSTFAKAGVRFYNNEMICYKKSQCRLKYLVEFEAE